MDLALGLLIANFVSGAVIAYCAYGIGWKVGRNDALIEERKKHASVLEVS